MSNQHLVERLLAEDIGHGEFLVNLNLEFWDALSSRAALLLNSAGGVDQTVNEM